MTTRLFGAICYHFMIPQVKVEFGLPLTFWKYFLALAVKQSYRNGPIGQTTRKVHIIWPSSTSSNIFSSSLQPVEHVPLLDDMPKLLNASNFGIRKKERMVLFAGIFLLLNSNWFKWKISLFWLTEPQRCHIYRIRQH